MDVVITWGRRHRRPQPLTMNRVRAAQLEIRQRAESAGRAAAAAGHPAERAALQGKRKAFNEASGILDALLNERPINFRRR